MNYGKAFKQIRESVGKSRPEMASDLGMTPSALWKIENGKAVPKPVTISRLCQLAGVSLAFVYISSLEPTDFK